MEFHCQPDLFERGDIGARIRGVTAASGRSATRPDQ
jgi:hypothetical protein